MQFGSVLLEEFEVWTVWDVTFVLPDCYVDVTWEQRKLGAGNAELAGLRQSALSYGTGTLPTTLADSVCCGIGQLG